MKRYSEYKDSGVKWIGEIPVHWKMPRLKMLTSFHNGDRSVNYPSGDDFVDDGIPFCGADSLCGLYVDLNYARFITDKKYKLLGGFKIRKNDILYTLRGSTIGKNAMALFSEGTVASSLMGIRKTTNRLISNYLLYTLNSICEENQRNVLINGSTAPNLSAEDVGIFFIPLPPLPEQEAIVTYLDSKVAKIDEYISIAEKKIAALEELKQTIIAEAVTRGIHKDVPMKDSGVKWIGMIPEHWKIMRLRFVCEFRNGYTPSKANPKFWENGTIPWFRMEDIRDSGRFLNEAKQYISKEAVKGDGLFEAGSFILATTATIGEHAMLIADSLANQQFTNLKIRKSLISKLSRNFFFYYLFVIDEYCKSTTRKATFPSVDMTDLKNIGVSIPPIEEQQEIVTYLDSKVANINQLCQAERSQIEKLKEYKQRLISDVVTGKVKVTND